MRPSGAALFNLTVLIPPRYRKAVHRVSLGGNLIAPCMWLVCDSDKQPQPLGPERAVGPGAAAPSGGIPRAWPPRRRGHTEPGTLGVASAAGRRQLRLGARSRVGDPWRGFPNRRPFAHPRPLAVAAGWRRPRPQRRGRGRGRGPGASLWHPASSWQCPFWEVTSRHVRCKEAEIQGHYRRKVAWSLQPYLRHVSCYGADLCLSTITARICHTDGMKSVP